MRFNRPAPWLITAVLVLLLALYASRGGFERQRAAAPAAGSDSPSAQRTKHQARKDLLARVGATKRLPPDSVALSRIHFADDDTLKLTLADLAAGRDVLIRNPTARTSLRLIVEDRRETHPLSQVLTIGDTVPAVRGGTWRRPGINRVRLTAAVARPKPGIYEGRLVVADTGRPVQREVQITVPEALPARADTAWTASIYKAAVAPPLRAWMFENAEGRCARDTRDRQGFSASALAGGLRYVMGTCARDNVIPLTGARTRGTLARTDSAAAKKTDSAGVVTHRPAQTLLGVLHSEKGNDQALVWWTGDSLNASGARQGVELQFTSFDHPGQYSGKIDLAGAGAEGIVSLRVRVTHDWPLALLAIAIGVYLSWWLRNYIRTRRAVLQMQATAAELVSRIEAANHQLRQVDSDEAGYLEYPVDESLLTRLRALERELQQHAYDGTVLEPGKPEHDTLRQQLNTCEQEVLVWEALAGVLAELRVQLVAAAEMEARLRPSDFAVLLARVETVFDGKRLPTADVAALTARARDELDAVRCWNEVAQNASQLKKTLDAAAADEEGRTASAAALEAALAELWASSDAEAAKRAGPKVAAAGKLYKPKKFKLPASIFGVGIKPAAAPPAAQGAPGKPGTWFAPAPAPPGNEGVMSGPFRLPVEGGAANTAESEEVDVQAREREQLRARNHEALKKQLARRTEDRQKAQDHRNHAEALRKRNERRYFWLTVGVAAATGLNQLYFKDGGFGTMQDYMVALLWGFGTKMGLDTVRTAVEGGRIPFLRDGAAAPAQEAGAQQTPAQPAGGQAAGNQSAANQTAAKEPAENKPADNQQPVGAGAPAGGNKPQVPPPDNPDGSSG